VDHGESSQAWEALQSGLTQAFVDVSSPAQGLPHLFAGLWMFRWRVQRPLQCEPSNQSDQSVKVQFCGSQGTPHVGWFRHFV